MLENLYTANNYVLSKKMLDASHIRHEALSNNIANVETPNYKRRDLPATFEKELNEAVERGDKVRLRDLPLRTEIDKRTKPIGLDGNNVELDKELLEINRNALNYTFLSQYVGGSIQTLNKAIKGHVWSFHRSPPPVDTQIPLLILTSHERTHEFNSGH